VVSEPSPTEAQPPKKKKPGPAKKRPAETAGTSFLSGEAIDLLTATSNGYELNGKRIAPALDVPAILKAARSKDARIQELGSLSCELVYLVAQLRKEKPNEEVERIAQARLARIDVECLKIVLDRVSAKELVGFGLNVAFMDALIKEGRKRGELVKPSADSEILEKLLLEKPLQELLRSTMIRLVGQAKGLASKEKIKTLVGKHVGSTPALRESIKIKLETLKDKQVVVTVTNQGMAPLHHCLLQSRAFPDPRLIERKINSDRAAMLLAAGFLGVGEKSTDNASLYTLLQYVLSNTERGALVYLPEIPAGGTVRLGLTTSEDLVYLKESELSLWCEELTLTKQLGTAAGFPPELVGTPFPLNDKAFASIKTELTPKDPRDPSAAPGRANVCKSV
jgi:hypothetical protein